MTGARGVPAPGTVVDELRRHLAAGRSLREAAAAMGEDLRRVQRLAARHGMRASEEAIRRARRGGGNSGPEQRGSGEG